MKILAQHGHQPSDKIRDGLARWVVDGVILSPRYIPPDKVGEKITHCREAAPATEILIDPEYYATRQLGTPNNQLGYLEDWSYFTAVPRRDLIRTDIVEQALRNVWNTVSRLDVSAHVAPNIYIPQSFDSIEAGIAINFIGASKNIFRDGKPVYATLAVDRRALLNPSEFHSFLNDLTALETPPDGFYMLVGGGLINERSDVVHSEIVDANVIGGWMLLNYVLSQNGFRVINGCADLLTPFLCAAGGDAGATGWWSNLRVFSMGRYVKPEGRGGQLPSVRYVSKLLLNRIRLNELFVYSRVLPTVLNGLPLDAKYTAGTPTRTDEAVQTWEALSALNNDLTTNDIATNLTKLRDQVTKAKAAYAYLQSRGISEGIETVTEYLNQLGEAVETFKRLAEL